ncbi:MAG TPA: putative sugar O-methyltransferase [Thalassobaculum sp.]
MKEAVDPTLTAAHSKEVLADCADAYACAKRFEARSDKSVHWNVFPGDFERSFAFADAWSRLLRNGITAGFNDDTLAVPDRWERRQRHDYSDMVPRSDRETRYSATVEQMFRFCAGRFGLQFVEAVLNTEVGSPRLAEFVVTVKNGEHEARRQLVANLHDLALVYFSGRIISATRSNETVRRRYKASRTLVEIGGGFGELSAKLKRVDPQLRSIIFDLPEPGAVQHYYLRHRFPRAKVYTVRDYRRAGPAVFDEPFDFLLLPPTFIKILPAGWPAVAVNIRSFQEMNWTSVVDYFVELQRAVPAGGVFCCVNRFSKPIGDQEISYDRFPFDDGWRTLSDGPVPFQTPIREGIFERG